MTNIESYSNGIFEKIKHITEDGAEYWYASELQDALGYDSWKVFKEVLSESKIAAENSGYDSRENFINVRNKIKIGSEDEIEVEDIILTRYASYLIVQNADPRKELVALGQSYFAVKTREKELGEVFQELTEEQKRISIREELKKHNKSLAQAARMAGIETSEDYSEFQNKGYEGLYDGMSARDIHESKGLKSNEKILDYMGSTELAANLFRATQTDEKLRREKISGKYYANQAHYDVGKKVRETIRELGGIMPERLPTPEKSIGEIQKKIKES